MRRLHHLSLSPFCRKIRLQLAEKKIEVDLIEERPWLHEYEFVRLNPAASVPVFVENDGAVFSDSYAISEYLEETYQIGSPLIYGNPTQRAEIRRLVGWFDDKMAQEVTLPLVDERVMKKLRGNAVPDGARLRAARANLHIHLEYIGWLIDQRYWLAGEELSLADFAAAAHISCLDYVRDIDWKNVPEATHSWYSRIKSRPAFRSLLQDHVTGHPAPEHYADLDF